MTTPGTASSTDARKRKAERDTDQPPVLPDTSEALEKVRDLAGTYCGQWNAEWMKPETFNQGVGAFAQEILALLGETPPAVEPAPWSVISTDRDKPTLARITYDSDFSETRLVFRDDHFIYDADSDDNLGRLDCIARVELLHTYDPETHVPVERALIERAGSYGTRNMARLAQEFPIAADLIEELSLAALADGAEKGADQ